MLLLLSERINFCPFYHHSIVFELGCHDAQFKLCLSYLHDKAIYHFIQESDCSLHFACLFFLLSFTWLLCFFIKFYFVYIVKSFFCIWIKTCFAVDWLWTMCYCWYFRLYLEFYPLFSRLLILTVKQFKTFWSWLTSGWTLLNCIHLVSVVLLMSSKGCRCCITSRWCIVCSSTSKKSGGNFFSVGYLELVRGCENCMWYIGVSQISKKKYDKNNVVYHKQYDLVLWCICNWNNK